MPSLAQILLDRKSDFFVQEVAKGPWHVESEEHCEYMLCGAFISIDAPYAKIQHTWGPIKCPDCWMLYERKRRTVFQ